MTHSSGWARPRTGGGWRFVIRSLLVLGPPVAFVVLSVMWIKVAIIYRSFGTDAELYTQASRVWLAGGDPWRTPLVTAFSLGDYFAGPPPLLLLYLPFTALPPLIVPPLGIALDVVCIVLVVRHLHLAWWWCLFPPAILATTYGQPEPVMLALLVLGPRSLAVLVKPYAAAVLVAERQWRSLAIAVTLLVVTAPLLPWGLFIDDLGWIRELTVGQSAVGDVSAWAFPALIPLAVLCLLSLGWRRAGWLATPVLLPWAQPHYATIAMPRLTPWVAVAFSLPFPGVGIVAAAMAAWQGRQTGAGPDSAIRYRCGLSVPGPASAK